jgi:uncharacterized protein (DUF934 family)
MRTPAALAAARPFAKPQRLQAAPDAASPDVVAALTAPVLSGGSGFSQSPVLRKGLGHRADFKRFKDFQQREELKRGARHLACDQHLFCTM